LEKAIIKIIENNIEKNAGMRGGNQDNRELYSNS